MLDRYRDKRDPSRTPEPFGERRQGDDDQFVIQEHHARSLHWDLRLERDGVLASWAVPKGLPPDPKVNHLAVRTEDHPMEYLTFEGEIPQGEYGGGSMTVWDRGTYTCEKWSEREVKIVLNGSRAQGRFVLFQTHGKNWMIHRMDPPARDPMPALEPMLAVKRAKAPRRPGDYAFEFAWGGRRTLATIDGGRTEVKLLRPLAESFGSRSAVLDGELVTLGGAEVYICYDLLYYDGHLLTGLPFSSRRETLQSLEISGARWQTAPSWPGEFGAVRQAARDQGLPGVIGKRLNSPYEPGESQSWLLFSA
ncbi:DNA polymerase ligase N-terminal domain-containing protein [Nonomuraea soli]|uniref:Bifunctional non-homologous end joining protein LigD n=1 Tax=Nonomuraea soli TaxID=1032476 RepID=A0A7W0CNH7_9ACTN|nr:DNA polymerase ligase N-terminal domain-containing protein [Nonomuraea soli]MBA2894185.1 bifunctional non-homologous end joining protein LigD [Nonomuraea soli]